MARRRSIVIAAVWTLVAAGMAHASITASEDGKGYKVVIGEWLQPGMSCSIDLDSYSLTGSTLYGSTTKPFYPAKGQGVLKLVADKDYRFVHKEWTLDRLPGDWNGVVRLQESMPETKSDGSWHEQKQILNVIVPTKPIAPPKSAVGQRFIVIPGESLPILRDDSGSPAKGCLLQPLTLSKIESGRYTFTVGATQRSVTLASTKPVLAIEGLEPIVEDAGIERLRDRYKGRCWDFPGAVSALSPDGLDRPFDSQFKPLKIRTLVRLWRTQNVMVSMAIGGIGGNSDEALWAGLHPVLAVLEPTGGHVIGNAPMEFSGTGITDVAQEIERRMNPRLYTHYMALALDGWHMERLLSPTPPKDDFRGASKAVRKGLYGHEMVRGMTYRQFAWVRGWPMIAGTKESIEAMKLGVWEYPSPVFSDTASFANGKFVGYHVPPLP